MSAQYTTPPVEPLLRINDVAAVLRSSRSLVYQLVNKGELHPIRVGERMRFSAADVRAYLNRIGLEEVARD